MRRPFTFGWLVAGMFLLAAAVRWFVLLRWYRYLPIGEINDNVYYHVTANLLANGHGFADPFEYTVFGKLQPTAGHPPGFTVYLSIWSFLGLDSVTWHRLAGGFISASAVIPVGLLARRLFNERTAVIGMVGTALYPPLWMNDALILSESMYIPIAAWTLWFAHRVYDEPSWRRITELTLVLSLGALTRSEPFMLFFLLLAPIILLHRSLDWRARITRTLGAALIAMLMLAPWVGRNLATFDEPTFLAIGPGYVLELGNCDDTYSGRLLGYWSPTCDETDSRGALSFWAAEDRLSTWPDGDESVIGAAKLDKALDYIGDHLSEQPKVAAARVGRVLGLYRPQQTADFDVFFERRVRSHVDIGLFSHYAVMTAAVYGAVVMRRRTTLLPVAAVAGTSILTAAITFGITRYRLGADVVFVFLAAVALGALLDRLRPIPALADQPEPVQPELEFAHPETDPEPEGASGWPT
ncbi:MAG: glycosyltransferase family 39 protein [Acidimicrobiaceae bacterium]|nr:glycosyltransferase family 39 protein [Acidimicrobiaceae bacterium]